MTKHRHVLVSWSVGLTLSDGDDDDDAVQQIEDNWRTGQCRMQRIQCRSEASKGVYCLQYDDQKIVSGLRDNTIKVMFVVSARTLICSLSSLVV